MSGSRFYEHRFSWTCKVFGPGFGPDYYRLLPANTACVQSFANGTNGIPMPPEVLPLAVIGYHWYQWYASGTTACHWVLPLVANLADNLTGRQNYNAPNDVIFKTATYENSVITVQFNAFPS